MPAQRVGQHGARVKSPCPWSAEVVGPALGLVVTAALLWSVAVTPTPGVDPRTFGPQSWPKFALASLAIGLAWLVVLRMRAALRATEAAAWAARAEPQAGDSARVLQAVAILGAYSMAFVHLGFLFSTVLFMAVRLAWAGFRRPLALLMISLLGTVLPLYLLVKVAFLPLPKGSGVIEQATVQVYQWLRLF
jgi:hypothetical protein